MNLNYGLRDVIPDDATGAFGARLIVTQDGHVDLVRDRIDFHGDTTKLDLLVPWGILRSIIESKLKSYEIDTRLSQQVTLFDEMGVTFVCNSNASAGYLYVSGWAA